MDTFDFDVVLHIGAGKCGSSALQRALSLNPEPEGGEKRRYQYATFDQTGRFATPSEIRYQALTNPFGYVSCPSVQRGRFDKAFLRQLSSGIGSLRRKGITPILSYEGWANQSECFTKNALLGRLGISALVVLYVRPPLDWLNSAWWQWGAWAPVSRERWMDQNLDGAKWDRIVAAWQNVPGVAAVSLRLATRDVVADFGRYFSMNLASEASVNKGLSDDLLRLMQRNRRLRPGPHDSAVDFAISRWLEATDATQAWVIPHDACRRYLRELRANVENLMELARSETACEIRADARWWDAGAYSDRTLSDEMNEPTVQSADRIAVALAEALVRCDAAVRELKRKQTGGLKKRLDSDDMP